MNNAPTSKMTPEARQSAIALADALDRLSNDGAQLHYDMRSRSEWGTGVTVGLERKLSEIANDLRSLVRAS